MTNSEKNHEQQTALLVSQGNPAAMKELYCATAEYLTAVCARYISDDEDVKDILQDSYVKIFTSAGKFEYRGEGSLRAWMTRIVVNESLKFLKRTEKSGILQYGDSIRQRARRGRHSCRTPARNDTRTARRLPHGVQPLRVRTQKPQRNSRHARHKRKHLGLAATPRKRHARKKDKKLQFRRP